MSCYRDRGQNKAMSAYTSNVCEMRAPRLISGVFLLIGALVGCGGGGGGVLPVENNLPSKTFAAVNLSFDSVASDSWLINQEFRNLSQYGTVTSAAGSAPASSLHPLVLTNVHKAYGYGLSGRGQGIGIFDQGFNTQSQFQQGQAFADMQSKYDANQLSLYGTITMATSSHGNQVASIAGARFDNRGYDFYLLQTGQRYPAFTGNAFDLFNHGMMGVAHNASLRLYDIASLNTFGLLARGVNDARQAGLKVLNNSWALSSAAVDGGRFGRDQAMVLPSTRPESLSAGTVQAASQWLSSYTANSVEDWASYLQALLDFQASGTVVFALQNERTARDPSLMAALPELLPALRSAWVVVGNIESRGDAAQLILPMSAPCGVTGPYCLVADGTEVTGAGLSNALGSSPGYSYGQTGASSAAPQISGMLALLAEAFPALSPEDLVTRLLATANNRFFAHTGERQFSREVKHGYNNVYGHGIPDMQAALQPIPSESRPIGFVLSGTPTEGLSQPLMATGIQASRALRSALGPALQGQVATSYDALGAGFRVPLAQLVRAALIDQPIAHWLNGPATQDGPQGKGRKVFLGPEGAQAWAGGVSLADLSLAMAGGPVLADRTAFADGPGHADGFMRSPMQLATSLPWGQGQLMGFVSRNQNRGAERVSPTGQLGSLQPNIAGLAWAAALSQGPHHVVQALVGVQFEHGSLRGTYGQGALETGSGSQSYFFSPMVRWQKQGWAFAAGASLGLTLHASDIQAQSMIQEIGPLVSSEFFASLSREGLWSPKGRGYVRLWQSETIESGTMTLRLPGLVGPRQTITTQPYQVRLSGARRDLYWGLGYALTLSRDRSLAQELFVLPNASRLDRSAVDLGWAIRFKQHF